MKMPKSAIVTSSLILVLLPDLLQAQTTPGSQDALKSVRKFVQDFYSWYFPNALKFKDSVDLALRDRGYVFSPELFKALKEDTDAQAKSPGHEIYVLVSDPFLNTQEPVERYELRGITQKGNKYLVEVLGVYPVRPFERPGLTTEVIAQVQRRNGHWVFTNFLYPSVDTQFGHTPNLLETLKVLREQRRGEKPDTRAK
jgi:hypothetical protein